MTQTKKILMVLTNHATLGDSGKFTGCWLSELTHVYDLVRRAGYEVDMVSPLGGQSPMDPASLRSKDPINATYLKDPEFVRQVEQTLTPSQVKPEDYAAVYYPGGHGPLWDVAVNPDIAQLTRSIYERGGIVAAVCHGPAGLLPVRLSNGTHLLAGQTVTGFSNLEEFLAGKTKWVPFSLEHQLRELTGSYKKSWPWMPYSIVSGRIITGQNPNSAKQVGQKLVSSLA